jgi:hypothetical protein
MKRILLVLTVAAVVAATVVPAFANPSGAKVRCNLEGTTQDCHGGSGGGGGGSGGGYGFNTTLEIAPLSSGGGDYTSKGGEGGGSSGGSGNGGGGGYCSGNIVTGPLECTPETKTG